MNEYIVILIHGSHIVNHWRNPWHPQLKRKVKFFSYMQSQLWCKISLGPSFFYFSRIFCAHFMAKTRRRNAVDTHTAAFKLTFMSKSANISSRFFVSSAFPEPFCTNCCRNLKKNNKKVKKNSAQTFFCDIHAASCDFFS